jgi:hypothetical protein
MSADLIAQIPPGERYARAARGWLDGVLTEVFPELLEGLRTRPAKGRWGDPSEPGDIRGEITLGIDDPRPRRSQKFSDAKWQLMLARLDESPLTASLSVALISADGRTREEAHVVVRWEDEDDWVHFTFSAPAYFTWREELTEVRRRSFSTVADDLAPDGSVLEIVGMNVTGVEKVVPGGGVGWAESPALQDRWAEFVKQQAGLIGACAGFMSDDQSPGSDTALEQAIVTGPPGGEIGRRRRQVLYGYSWVTIVPAELAVWLGGAAALAATGAFFEVSELPGGALWLRATRTINEFTGDRIRAVFEALAPVLVTGRTRFIGYQPRLVEGVDAVDYQSPDKTPARPARLPPPGQDSALLGMDAVLWADRGDAELTGAERGWMLGVLQTLIPDLLAATDTRPGTAEMPVKDPLSWPLDGPDTLAGELRIRVEDPYARDVWYSPTGWRRLLAALDKSPATVEIRVHVFDADGEVRGGGEVSVRRSEFEPGWVRFSFSARANTTGWPWSPAMQHRWAELLKDQAARIGACTGFMTDTGTPGEGLSHAIRRPGQRPHVENPDDSITRSRQVLQDYCWVTIVPAELTRRLGGAAGLRASGAFCDVSELPDGSVWLRATPTINEFTGERITAVFRALAPVLLTGRTEFSFGYRRLVENADAADYR